MELYWLIVAAIMGGIVYKLVEDWKEREDSFKEDLRRWAKEEREAKAQEVVSSRKEVATNMQQSRSSLSEFDEEQRKAKAQIESVLDVEKHVVWKYPSQNRKD